MLVWAFLKILFTLHSCRVIITAGGMKEVITASMYHA